MNAVYAVASVVAVYLLVSAFLFGPPGSFVRQVRAELARWNWLFIAVWTSLLALGLFSWWVLWALL